MSKSKKRIYNHLGGNIPGTVPPSQLIRYWNEGLLVAFLALSVTYPLALLATQFLPNPAPLPFFKLLLGSLAATWNIFSLGTYESAVLSDFLRIVQVETLQPWRIWSQIGLAWTAAIGLAWWLSKASFVPRNNESHVSGPEALKGKEAAQELAHRNMTTKERQNDPYCLLLHPDLFIAKRQASRHVAIYGSPGSGKSVAMKVAMNDAIRRNLKCFIYDVKGDFTATFRKPIIVSPFDQRSHVWDVAKDVDTPSKAAIFAASIINDPGNPGGNFWVLAARSLFEGAVKELQSTKPLEWGFEDLSKAIYRDQAQWIMSMSEWHQQAVNLVNGSGETVQSIQATLSGLTKVIHDLAAAWPTPGKRRFAISEWVSDGYEGRKQVIVQGGPDAALTANYIGAMINCAVPEILSPRLPDNERGRFLGFFFDELTSIARLNINGLFEMGRSKGVVAYIGFQDIAQVQRVYGDKEAATLMSMIANQIICQVQPSDTRDHIAQKLGKKKVAWFSHQDKAVVHEESRNVVSPNELTTDLGFVEDKRIKPEGKGVKAIIALSGKDPLFVTFPVITYPKKREGQVEAKWMRELAVRMSQQKLTEIIADAEGGEAFTVQTIGTLEPTEDAAPKAISKESISDILERHLKSKGAKKVERVKLDSNDPFGFE